MQEKKKLQEHIDHVKRSWAFNQNLELSRLDKE